MPLWGGNGGERHAANASTAWQPKRGLLAWLETANAGIMSDFDEAADLEAARLASFVARCYTLGWRAYLEGRPCPKHPASERGWMEARHAREVCWREIMWSQEAKYIAPSSI